MTDICGMNTETIEDQEPRSVWQAIRRGFGQRCPSCGEASLYRAYVKVRDDCPSCGAALHHHRADDMPPYLTILLVGHILIPLVLMTEQAWRPETWVHWAVWIPSLVLSSLWLLPRLKGAVIGLQWANRMHGFGGEEDQPVEP